MNLIAGRPPPTYKTRPDPEFWRNFTRSTQPSADDAASDPGRRLGGQNLYAAAAAWRLVLQRIRQRHRNEYWRISFFQPWMSHARQEARIVRGAAALKRVSRHRSQFGPRPNLSRLTTTTKRWLSSGLGEDAACPRTQPIFISGTSE